MLTSQIFVTNPAKRFSEILQESEFNGFIPSNYIIDKKRPGLGCTHSELTCQRNSIILEPYLAVIEVKKVKFPKELCVVTGEFTAKEVDQLMVDYLSDSTVKYKKFMTTPESFHKVIRVLNRFDSDYRKNYFLLIDECEKWIKQALFRSKILKPLDEFFEFDQKAMISATPIIPSYHKFTDQGFKVLEIQPLFDYKKDIKLITTNNIRASCRNYLSPKNDALPVFVFTNCRDTIYYLTQLEFVKDDFKVFCAEDLDLRFFKNQNLPNVQYSVKDQRYAKYNFLTSRFFSAVDIDFPTKAHVIIVTNIHQCIHSIIDPVTDGIQIYGRCRAGVESITHITNIYPNRIVASKAEILKDSEEEISLIVRLKELQSKCPSRTAKLIAEDFMDKQFACEVFNEDDTINDFKRITLLIADMSRAFTIQPILF